MMARGSDAPSMGRIQKRKTNLSKSSLSACNARPVHTEGPASDVTHTPGQRALHGNIRFSQSLDTALEVTWILIWQDASLPFD